MSFGKARSVVLISVIIASILAVASVVGAQQNSPCVTGGAVPAGNEDLVRDCETLLGLKSALRGTAKLNWWAGRPINKWDGVLTVVDVHGQESIFVLYLQARGLNGVIPPELGNLTQLGSLDLSDNRLTGSIPPELGNLSSLRTLDLSDNELTGKIPAELGNLSNLTKWRLGGNSLTGCVPNALTGVADNDWNRLGLPSCGGSSPPSGGPVSTPTPPVSTPTPTPLASTPSTSLPDLLEDVKNSVVCVSVTTSESKYLCSTGFYVDDKGTVLTAEHVVDHEDLTAITVFNSAGRQFRYRVARVVAEDAALLVPVSGRVQSKAVRLADSYRQGEAIFTYGYSDIVFSDDLPVVTTGVVGASFTFGGSPQIAAALGAAPGGSGGPIFTMQGEVVGVLWAAPGIYGGDFDPFSYIIDLTKIDLGL